MSRLRERVAAGEQVVGALVIGDSIARGDEAPTPSKGFMSLWAEEIHRRHGCRVVVTNLSMGGATARTAYRTLRQVISLHDYRLLIVAVGVNDAALRVPVRRFAKRLRKIGRHAMKHGLEVLVITPPRVANADTDPYASAIRRSGFPYVDVHEASAEIRFANGINHPDAAGHELYARLLLEATDPAPSAGNDASP